MYVSRPYSGSRPNSGWVKGMAVFCTYCKHVTYFDVNVFPLITRLPKAQKKECNVSCIYVLYEIFINSTITSKGLNRFECTYSIIVGGGDSSYIFCKKYNMAPISNVKKKLP